MLRASRPPSYRLTLSARTASSQATSSVAEVNNGSFVTPGSGNSGVSAKKRHHALTPAPRKRENFAPTYREQQWKSSRNREPEGPTRREARQEADMKRVLGTMHLNPTVDPHVPMGDLGP